MLRAYCLRAWVLANVGLTVADLCGGTTIVSQNDADAIKSCSVVAGDVVLSPDASDPIIMDGVASINGSLISTGSRFSSFAAPALVSVSKDIAFHNVTDASSISLPQISTIGGAFDFDSLPALSSLDISSLSSVGSFRLASASNLASMTLQSIKNVTGPTPSVNITSVGLSYVSGFNDSSRLSSFIMQDVPKLAKFVIYTAEMDQVLIRGNGSLQVTFYGSPNRSPKSIGTLNITGCGVFFPYPAATTVDTANIYQNEFSDLDLSSLRITNGLRILDNPSLQFISLPNPESITKAPPPDLTAPQWKDVQITGNPRLSSSNIKFGSAVSLWAWNARNLFTLTLGGCYFHTSFFASYHPYGVEYPLMNRTYMNGTFSVDSKDSLFDCSYLNSLRSKGLFQGSYSCQGATVAAGKPPSSIARRQIVQFGVLLGALVMELWFIAL